MNSIPSPVASVPVNPSPKAAASQHQASATQGDDVAAPAAERPAAKPPAKESRRSSSGDADNSSTAATKESGKSPGKQAARAQQGDTGKTGAEPAGSGGKTVKQPTPNCVAANPATSTGRPAEADAADFAVALAQTLNSDGAAPQATAPLTTKSPVNKGPVKAEPASEVDLAALQAILGMPLPVAPLQPQPQTFAAHSSAQTAVTSQQGSDALVGVSAQAGRDVLALLNEIQDNSTAAMPADGTDIKGSPTPFTLPTQITDAVQTTRAAASEAPAGSRPMHTPVGTQAWADELSTRVSLMATKQGHQTASLSLTPEHLGPLEIRISVRDDQASVWFGAAHADTRAAIEHALPKLREQFASQGLSLADAGVFREPPRDNTRREVSGSASSADRDPAPVESTVAVVARRMGLVDAFA